jgi:hypothetical protein
MTPLSTFHCEGVQAIKAIANCPGKDGAIAIPVAGKSIVVKEDD